VPSQQTPVAQGRKRGGVSSRQLPLPPHRVPAGRPTRRCPSPSSPAAAPESPRRPGGAGRRRPAAMEGRGRQAPWAKQGRARPAVWRPPLVIACGRAVGTRAGSACTGREGGKILKHSQQDSEAADDRRDTCCPPYCLALAACPPGGRPQTAPGSNERQRVSRPSSPPSNSTTPSASS
jgi:hypothetical protein